MIHLESDKGWGRKKGMGFVFDKEAKLYPSRFQVLSLKSPLFDDTPLFQIDMQHDRLAAAW